MGRGSGGGQASQRVTESAFRFDRQTDTTHDGNDDEAAHDDDDAMVSSGGRAQIVTYN